MQPELSYWLVELRRLVDDVVVLFDGLRRLTEGEVQGVVFYGALRC